MEQIVKAIQKAAVYFDQMYPQSLVISNGFNLYRFLIILLFKNLIGLNVAFLTAQIFFFFNFCRWFFFGKIKSDQMKLRKMH